jgi:hypothetical protein
MMNKPRDIDNSMNHKKIWRQNEIFDSIWNDKIDKFFENYKQFDKFLKIKDKNALIYSGHVWLGGEESWKLHSDFYEAFRNSIKWIVWEETFERMRIFFDNKDYLLSTDMKRYDGDPFLDDKFQTIVLWNNTVAQFIERRNESNDIEFHYTVYPEHIFKFIEKLLKR